MNKLGLYVKFVWVCFISLFAPGETMNKRVQALLAEMKHEKPEPKA